MKVLMVSPVPPKWGGISMGGMANALFETATRMSSLGHVITVYAYNTSWLGKGSRYAVYGGVRVASRPRYDVAPHPLFIMRHYGLMRFLKSALRFRGIRRHLLKYGLKDRNDAYIAAGELVFFSKEVDKAGPDIIHLHIPNKSTITLPFLKRNVPLVVTVHKHHSLGMNPHSAINDIKRAQKILKMSIPYMDHIISVSESVAREVVDMGAERSKVSVIPNGVDTRKFSPMVGAEARKALGIKHQGPLVLFSGRLEKIKGVDILIEAWEDVVKEINNAMLYIVGDGSMREELEAMVRKKGLKRWVRFTGAVEHEEMPLWYSSADVFCLPSKAEAFPLSILEAMACGVTPIGADVSGAKDVIKHGKNGLIFKPQSPKALSNAIIHLLLQEKERKKLGLAARLTALEYSWDKVLDSIMDVYRTVRERG